VIEATLIEVVVLAVPEIVVLRFAPEEATSADDGMETVGLIGPETRFCAEIAEILEIVPVPLVARDDPLPTVIAAPVFVPEPIAMKAGADADDPAKAQALPV
jgi:hypothetical protein